MDLREIPQDWKQALVVPIFKKGDKHQLSNYRPVSLTSITCKLLEHIIHSNIMHHFDQHRVLCDNQHGFRKKRSFETQLLSTIQEIASSTAKGHQVPFIYATAKGQTNHAQADQKLFFQCSLLEQCSKSFSFAEMNIFAWWAKIVAVGRYRRIICYPEKIMGRRLARKPA